MERNWWIGGGGNVSLSPFSPLSPFHPSFSISPLSPFPHSPSISSPFPHSLPISLQPNWKAAAGCDSLHIVMKNFLNNVSIKCHFCSRVKTTSFNFVRHCILHFAFCFLYFAFAKLSCKKELGKFWKESSVRVQNQPGMSIFLIDSLAFCEIKNGWNDPQKVKFITTSNLFSFSFECAGVEKQFHLYSMLCSGALQ